MLSILIVTLCMLFVIYEARAAVLYVRYTVETQAEGRWLYIRYNTDANLVLRVKCKNLISYVVMLSFKNKRFQLRTFKETFTQIGRMLYICLDTTIDY